MQHLVNSVRQALKDKNWYAALMASLALPDIAAKLDGKSGTPSDRFIAWYDGYLLATFTSNMPPDGLPHVFLSGKDCYALRCAYLHAGDFAIEGQKIRTALERFHFTAPSPLVRHCNLVNNVLLQLQVDLFCEEICAAVDAWLLARGGDPAVASAIVALPQIDFN